MDGRRSRLVHVLVGAARPREHEHRVGTVAGRLARRRRRRRHGGGHAAVQRAGHRGGGGRQPHRQQVRLHGGDEALEVGARLTVEADAARRVQFVQLEFARRATVEGGRREVVGVNVDHLLAVVRIEVDEFVLWRGNMG